MGIAVPAPSMTGGNIGGIFSNGTKVATGGLGPVIVGLGAIFASQSLGEDSDKIPGVTAGIPSDQGLNNPGVMMGGKTQTQSQSKAEEKDTTCTADNPNCKKQEEHRGNIQSQEGTNMLCGKNVPTPSAAKWLLKTPPSHAFLMLAIQAVRMQIRQLKGSSYQKGADIAEKNIIAYYSSTSNLTHGIKAENEVFCYFNGVSKKNSPMPFKGKDSRRIDGFISKGRAIK